MRLGAVKELLLALDIIHALASRLTLVELTDMFTRRWGELLGAAFVVDLLEADVIGTTRTGKVFLTDLGRDLRTWLSHGDLDDVFELESKVASC